MAARGERTEALKFDTAAFSASVDGGGAASEKRTQEPHPSSLAALTLRADVGASRLGRGSVRHGRCEALCASVGRFASYLLASLHFLLLRHERLQQGGEVVVVFVHGWCCIRAIHLDHELSAEAL